MTETLVPIPHRNLHTMEIPQLIIRFIDDYETSKIKSTDEDFKRVLNKLKTDVNALIELQRSVTINEDKNTLRQADKVRDHDFKALMTGIRMYRTSSRPVEKSAYDKLSPLVKNFKKSAKRNYEEETFAINNLLGQLKLEPFSTSITTLSLTKLVTNLTESQTQFDTLFKSIQTKLPAKAAASEIKKAREALFQTYVKLCRYIENMVWMKGTDSYKKLLTLINNGRQFYIGEINRRNNKDKTKKLDTSSEESHSPSEETANEANDSTLEVITPTTYTPILENAVAAMEVVIPSMTENSPQ